jgi:hypothetical protein
MFSRNLKIAAILAVVCVCVRPATGQQTQTAAPPAKEAQTTQPAKESQPQPAEQTNVVVFTLRYSDVETMARVLDKSLGGKDEVHIAIDKQKNALIIRGTEDQLNTAKAILKRLDAPSPSEIYRSLAVNVRIFWLVEGDQNAAAPPEGLKDVVEELHRQGLKNIGQAAQTMVRSQYEGVFQISCSPLVDKKPITLAASGKILADSKLQVRISATETTGMDKPGEKLANVDVNTVYKTNDYIVLAVAPIGKITSVFVIQITEGKP